MSKPKLNIKEETSAKKTRSPPKKAKVEQSVPRKKKLKTDADKAAEKAQHLRFGKAELTPDELSRLSKAQKREMYAAHAARSAVHREVDQYEDDNVGTQALSEGEKAAGDVRDISKSRYARKLKKKAKMQGKKGTKTAKSSASEPTAAQDAGASGTGEGGSNWLSRWRQKQDIRQSYYAAARSGTAAQTAGGKAASNGASAARSGMEQAVEKGKTAVSTAVKGLANAAKSNAHVLVIVGVFLLLMPIFREEPLAVVRELYEQQDEALDAAPEKAVDYKVGDSVVVDLPTRTIEGTIGYVGETDVRIDTSAQGYSWSNEVLNRQQFEDGLRQDEPELSDEELDKLPISVEVNGEWQTFPDAAAADEALNAEPVPEAAGNFHITNDHLGEGGAKQKYARNIAAIRTLFQLEQEHRGATAEEQEMLSQYVGWGGLPDAFDPDKDNWAKEYTELKGLLSEDEYAAARSSVLNAHYTSPTVIRAIYDTFKCPKMSLFY